MATRLEVTPPLESFAARWELRALVRALSGIGLQGRIAADGTRGTTSKAQIHSTVVDSALCSVGGRAPWKQWTSSHLGG